MYIGFEEVTRIRGPQLVNNKLGPNNSHEPFALLENKGKPDEIYRRVDCCLLVDTNGYIPEKGTASLRENLKVMRSNNQVPSKNEKGKISNQIKKSNLPTNPMLALIQLRVWVHLEDAENLFAKIFLVTDLLWLLWAFGVKTPLKRKNALVPLLVNHLKNETPFSDEALARKSMFAPE
jgi:hypothetical protein